LGASGSSYSTALLAHITARMCRTQPSAASSAFYTQIMCECIIHLDTQWDSQASSFQQDLASPAAWPYQGTEWRQTFASDIAPIELLPCRSHQPYARTRTYTYHSRSITMTTHASMHSSVCQSGSVPLLVLLIFLGQGLLPIARILQGLHPRDGKVWAHKEPCRTKETKRCGQARRRRSFGHCFGCCASARYNVAPLAAGRYSSTGEPGLR
jgi:hypothetical protein